MTLPIVDILFRPFGFIILLPKTFLLFGFPIFLSIMSVPDEGYYVPDEGYYVHDEGYYVPDEGYFERT